jgi:hypothetical protein
MMGAPDELVTESQRERLASSSQFSAVASSIFTSEEPRPTPRPCYRFARAEESRPEHAV